MRSSTRRYALFAVGLLFGTSCAPTYPQDVSRDPGQVSAAGRPAPTSGPAESSASNEGKPGKVTLRVSLYPWVPEPESLFRWIEQDFEEKNGDIDLVVRDYVRSLEDESNKSYRGDLAYEIEKTAAALTGQAGDDSWDLIEVDTVTLGALKATEAIVPFGIEGGRFHPFAADAVKLAGQSYGVPHWTCGYFVISENAGVRDAKDVDSLLKLLSATPNATTDIAGRLDGSWDSITVYLDAVRDTDANRDLGKELKKNTLDPVVASSLEAIGRACKRDGKSLCEKDPSALFAAGQVDALVGYSERLHTVLSTKDRKVKALHLSSAPLGRGNHPMMFTDALVLSKRCVGACRVAAQKFAAYYVADETFEVALLAKDVGAGAVPRYLLPSTETAFSYGGVAKDELYGQLRAAIPDAMPMPNEGLPEARARGILRQEVQKRLGIAR